MVLDTVKKNVWYQKVDGSDSDLDPVHETKVYLF
jgi:hypothetical protein